MMRFAAGAAALLLSACAAFAPSEPALPTLAAVPPAFEMSGRLAVRRGASSEIAQLRWTRRHDSDVWVIASPLGNEVARIESTPEGATLTLGGEPGRRAASFEDLTAQVLGVALDPAALAHALHGEAPREMPDGWRFHIDETQDSGAVRLAKRITATNGDTVVRLVVDRYRALPD